jgi:hypothetical protein
LIAEPVLLNLPDDLEAEPFKPEIKPTDPRE